LSPNLISNELKSSNLKIVKFTRSPGFFSAIPALKKSLVITLISSIATIWSPDVDGLRLGGSQNRQHE